MNRQRHNVKSTVRYNMVVKAACITAIVCAVVAVIVLSLKNEDSRAGETVTMKEVNVLERVHIEDVNTKSFAPLKNVEIVRDVFIDFDHEEERLDIDFGRATESTVDLKIYDVFGELVASDQIDEGTTKLTYKLSFVDPGVYTLKTISTQQTIIRKLIVNRDIFGKP